MQLIRALFISLALGLVLNSPLSAQDNIGVAAYGIQSPKFSCNQFMEVVQELPVPRLSMLWNTFGTDTSCIERFLNTPGQKVIELHLINESCQRYKRCGKYEFLYGIPKKAFTNFLTMKDPAFLTHLRNYFSAPANFLKSHKEQDRNLTCYISPSLESNLTNPAAISTLLDETRKAFPFCKIVWNPLAEQSKLNADLIEGHTSQSPYQENCIANLDGEDYGLIDLVEYVKKYSSCELNFLWTRELNGVFVGHIFVDPRRRTHFPRAKDWEKLKQALAQFTGRTMQGIQSSAAATSKQSEPQK